MILLLIIPSWILVLAVVVGLCFSARRGDEQEERAREVPASGGVAAADRLPASKRGSQAAPTHQPTWAGRTAA